MRVYLDHNATTPMRQSAKEAMHAAMEMTGNGSSVHSEGRAARALIEDARHDVAALVGADAEDVIFTSGGTEANTFALSPLYGAGPGKRRFRRLITSAMEHASVLAGGRFAADTITRLPATADGVVSLPALDNIAGFRPNDANDTGTDCLVSIALANNETGVVQPVRSIASRAARAGALVHTDGVQAAGKMAVDMNALGVDMLSLSAHKLGGPQGIGALVVRRRDLVPAPLLTGGGQERNRRAGTENIAAIAGFAAAARAAVAQRDEIERLNRLRVLLERGIGEISPEAILFGERAPRLSNTTCFGHPGLAAETLVIAFDLAGIAISAGSACSSGRIAASHVIESMYPGKNLSGCAVRVSLGRTTRAQDIHAFLAAWTRIYAQMAKKPPTRNHRSTRGRAASGDLSFHTAPVRSEIGDNAAHIPGN